MPLAWHDATVALPALSWFVPTLSVAANPYTAPKIVSESRRAKSVFFCASAFVALSIVSLLFLLLVPAGRQCPLSKEWETV